MKMNVFFCGWSARLLAAVVGVMSVWSSELAAQKELVTSPDGHARRGAAVGGRDSLGDRRKAFLSGGDGFAGGQSGGRRGRGFVGIRDAESKGNWGSYVFGRKEG